MRLKPILFASAIAIASSLFFTETAYSAPPAKAFGELPMGYDAAISPNGEELAIIVNVKGVYGVISQKVDGSSDNPWFLTLGENINPGYVKWVNNHTFVISVGKSEKYRSTPFTTGYLFAGDINTRKGKFVVTPRSIFRQYNNRVVDWLEDDPDHILMAYSDEQFDPYPDIKKVEVASGSRLINFQV